MRFRTNRVAIGIAALITLLVMVLSTGNEKRQTASSNPPVSTPTTNQKGQTAPKQPAIAVPIKLRTAAAKFAKAYYHTSYTDTEDSHRAYLKRHGPVISPKLLMNLYFGIEEKNALNEQRWQLRLGTRGLPLPEKIKAKAGSTTSHQTITMPVIYRIVRHDGVETSRSDPPILTQSEWRKQKGKWKIMSFTEGESGRDGL